MQELLTETKKQTVSGFMQLILSSNYSERVENMPFPTMWLSSYDYKAKFQYQLVYEDVGKPLNKTPNLKLFSKRIYNTYIGTFCSCSIDN